MNFRFIRVRIALAALISKVRYEKFIAYSRDLLPKKARRELMRLKHGFNRRAYLKVGEEESRWLVKRVQIEITYRCNLLCKKCNRYCNLIRLPYLKDSEMTLAQIEKFINQVKEKRVRLDRIDVMGGEPFLHPELEDFISALFYGLVITGYLKHIMISTNGAVKYGFKKISLDPRINTAFKYGIISFNTDPGPKDGRFAWVLAAPVDLGFKWNTCEWPRECGVLLNAHGYWPTGVCGSIARLFRRAEYARYDFPVEFEETWPGLKQGLCKYCSHASDDLKTATDGKVTWSYKKAIQDWMRSEVYKFKKF